MTTEDIPHLTYLCSKVPYQEEAPFISIKRIEHHLFLVSYPSCMSYILEHRGYEVLAEVIHAI